MGRPSSNMNRAEIYSVHAPISAILAGQAQPLRRIPRADALEMIERKEAQRISRPKEPIVKIRLNAPERAEQTSAAGITRSEMESNGLGQLFDARRLPKLDRYGNELREGNYVDAAMTKVEEYPLPSLDVRAVTVVPRAALSMLTLSFCCLMFLLSYSVPASAKSIASHRKAVQPHCGTERWPVKILADAQHAKVAAAIPATVHDLIQIDAPTRKQLQTAVNDRFPDEFQAYTVTAYLAGYKLESDMDFHLVLRDPQTGETMIAEIPSPKCAKDSKLGQQWTRLRAFVEQYGPATSKLRRPNALLTFTGVFFFDFLHGQTGVAPNGAELHPILAIADGLKGSSDDEDEQDARSGQTKRAGASAPYLQSHGSRRQ